METTVRWLTNKLGEENWVPSQIGSLLRPENMDAAVDSYDALSPGVKIRLLLSMLHLERHQMEDLEGTVKNLKAMTRLKIFTNYTKKIINTVVRINIEYEKIQNLINLNFSVEKVTLYFNKPYFKKITNAC